MVNRHIVAFLAEFAARKRTTPSQVASARLLAEKAFIVRIQSTCSVENFLEHLGALEVVLTPGDLAEIDGHLAAHPLRGCRMSAERM